MQVVTLSQSITFDGAVLPANEGFVWSDGFVEGFRQQAARFITRCVSLNSQYRHYRGQSLRGKSLLLWRTGGYGDLLFLTPLIRELKRRWPTARITVACRPKYHMIFRRNADVAQMLPLPVALSTLEAHDYHLHFEGTIEHSTDPQMHAVDLFARHAGIRLSDRRLKFSLSAQDLRFGRESLAQLDPHNQHRHVAVQVRASSPVRTYPWKLLERVVRGLVERNCQVFLLGSPWERPNINMPGVFNFCGAFQQMEQSVALMSSCDLLIAPDSSLVHFAGALGLLTIALYGPFPANVRTRYYERCIALEPHFPCVPCFTHGHLPCTEAQELGQADSPCFFKLPPERIIAEVDFHFDNKETISCSS